VTTLLPTVNYGLQPSRSLAGRVCREAGPAGGEFQAIYGKWARKLAIWVRLSYGQCQKPFAGPSSVSGAGMSMHEPYASIQRLYRP
jgi:hypothetical protein